MGENFRNLLYFAYGEHMNEDEMMRDFPNARMVGLSRLKGYRLCFAGRDGVARAALEPDTRGSVVGRVWSLRESDADALDRLADAPHFARGEIHMVHVDGVEVPVLVYMTKSARPYGRPGFVTYDAMREAYASAGEDVSALRTLAMQCVP